MKNSEHHRPAVHPEYLVKRSLKVQIGDSGDIDSALAEIDDLRGADVVSYDPVESQISIAYDASILCIDCLEEIFSRWKVSISHDLWNRLKESYYKFVDQNIKDNSTHEPWSCHNPGHGQRKP